MLAGREDRVGHGIAGDAAVLLDEEAHRVRDALELAARHHQIARHTGARAEHDCVEAREELRARGLATDVDARLEDAALGAHLLDAEIEEILLHLEVGDPVSKETAQAVVALVDDDVVASPRELLRCSKTRGAGADDRHLLAAAQRSEDRRETATEAFLDRGARDGALDVLDGDRCISDVEHARRFARRRADATGHLGEVVRRVEHANGVGHAPAMNEVVELRDDVAERTALVTERDAAIHAARGLRAEVALRGLHGEFAVVREALRGGALLGLGSCDLQEPTRIGHGQPPFTSLRRRCESVAATVVAAVR